MPLCQGEVVHYLPYRGTTKLNAEIISSRPIGQMIEVKIVNDPFTSMVEKSRLVSKDVTKSREYQKNRSTQMPTGTTSKQLRSEARKLKIDGWEDMDRESLEEAIALAQESDEDSDEETTEDEESEVEEAPTPRRAKSKTTSKTPAKKASATKSTAKASTKAKPAPVESEDDDEPSGPNPFRPGTNLYLITERLMRGGKRSTMVKDLNKKIELKPRKRGGVDFDADVEMDYRIVRVCQALANNHDFTIEKDGRGVDQQVKAIPAE